MEKENRQFKMGSLFDGSGGFPLAASLCGIEPAWASEIEPFPIKVTRARFPDMKHYGDISKINGADLEPVDLVTGGSPCQDMSVAGKRNGMSKQCPKCDFKIVGNADIKKCPDCGEELEYTRSGLFMEQIRIIKEMREADELRQLRMRGTVEHIRPRIMVWENVTGAFSSNKGEDFRAVLEETARIVDKTAVIPRPPKGKWNNAGLIMADGYSIAWRVLDAQYWGVPQRRRRIALVADFGGQCAGEILFKRDGLSRNFTESRHSWQSLTGCVAESVGEAGQYSIDFGRTADRIQMNADKAVTLLGLGGGAGAKTGLYCLPKPLYIDTSHADDVVRIDEKVSALQARSYKGGNNVAIPVTMQVRCGKEGGGKGALLQNDMSATLSTSNMQTLFQPVYSVDEKMANTYVWEDQANTLAARDYKQPQAVVIPKKAYGICSYASNSMKSDNPNSGIYEADTSRTLDLNGGNPACNQGGIVICEPVKTYDVRITSDGTKNARAHCYETDTSRTVDRSGNNPDSNHGGVAICEPIPIQDQAISNGSGNGLGVCYSLQGNMIGREDHNGPQGSGVNEDVCFTLNTTDRHAVAYDCRNMVPNKDVSATLQAKSNGGQSLNYINPVFVEDKKSYQNTTGPLMANTHPGSYTGQDAYNDMLVATEYIVRRLTPLECSRLQGFPDCWTDGIEIPEPTEEDLQFWREVFETHRQVVSGAKKPKTDKQIIKWLKEPDTDGAKYKLWGNGIALPCFLYVMEGIKEILEREEQPQ